MERELKKAKTSNGVEYEIVTYATAREAQVIETKLYGTSSVGVSSEGKTELQGFSPMFRVEHEKEMIRVLVKSINGKTENVLDLALELRVEDYSEIVMEVSKLVKKN